jgi:hypothetical protein
VGHLAKPEAAELLDELHGAARADRSQFLRLLPRLAFGFARGRTFAQTITPEALKNAFIAVPREEGWFLHLTARAIGATGVVEFGTSFGISTIYLGAAVVDNGGGWVVGSELLPSKHQRAVANLKRAGLEQVVDVRLGDALETLRETPSVVLADNIYTFRKALRPYVEYVQSGENGFDSATLSISDGVEYSFYRGRDS